MQGIVYNIQRMSTKDGPGLRTTVFLKGCPLHCPLVQQSGIPELQAPTSGVHQALRGLRGLRAGLSG